MSAEDTLLAALVDASLLRVRSDDGEPRYVMLETVREYAADLLAVSPGRVKLERRHVEWLTALARRGAAARPRAR